MVAIFDQLLGTNQSKVASTSLVISPSSKTVTIGKTIFVSFASDDVGSAFGIIDNLGNTYAQVGSTQISAGNVKVQLWAAPVTIGGSITTITISWTTNITAKVGVAGEFSNFGTLRLTDGGAGNGTGAAFILNKTFFSGELWVGAAGVEDDITLGVGTPTGTPSQTCVVAGANNTTGGGSTSNIGGALLYALINADSSATGSLISSSPDAQDHAGAGAIYNAVAASVRPRAAIMIQAVNRASLR